jgi:hypothetical protein
MCTERSSGTREREWLLATLLCDTLRCNQALIMCVILIVWHEVACIVLALAHELSLVAHDLGVAHSHHARSLDRSHVQLRGQACPALILHTHTPHMFSSCTRTPQPYEHALTTQLRARRDSMIKWCITTSLWLLALSRRVPISSLPHKAPCVGPHAMDEPYGPLWQDLMNSGERVVLEGDGSIVYCSLSVYGSHSHTHSCSLSYTLLL